MEDTCLDVGLGFLYDLACHVMFLFVPWHSSRAFCTTVLCTGSGLRRELPLPAAASSAWNAGLLPITTKQMPRAKGWESDRPMSPPLPFSCAHCVTSNNHWASQKPFPPSASGAGDTPILQDGSWRLHKVRHQKWPGNYPYVFRLCFWIDSKCTWFKPQQYIK